MIIWLMKNLLIDPVPSWHGYGRQVGPYSSWPGVRDSHFQPQAVDIIRAGFQRRTVPVPIRLPTIRRCLSLAGLSIRCGPGIESPVRCRDRDASAASLAYRIIAKYVRRDDWNGDYLPFQVDLPLGCSSGGYRHFGPYVRCLPQQGLLLHHQAPQIS